MRTWREWRAKKFSDWFILQSNANPALTDIEQAWGQGFKEGVERAASLVSTFENHRNKGVSVLIRAIGRAEVDENGQRLQDQGPVEMEDVPRNTAHEQCGVEIKEQ